jgi:hypothetical protein
MAQDLDDLAMAYDGMQSPSALFGPAHDWEV